MRLIIAGGRDLIITTKQIREFINFFNLQPSIIVHGGATGIDSCGSNYANEWGLSSSVFLPEWDKHRKAAGPIRNQQMIDVENKLDEPIDVCQLFIRILQVPVELQT